MPKIVPEVLATAAQCRHYAMCKIDYLATGLCPSGPEKHFVTYYPQGRMDLYRGLAEGPIPVTEALAESADTCTLCGVCDPQCHFVTGLQPTAVMRALKDYVAEHRRENREVVRTAEDAGLREIRGIVGGDWSTNDPAVLWTYADDPFPLAGPQMPRYVVLPCSRDEVAAVVSLLPAQPAAYLRESDKCFAVEGSSFLLLALLGVTPLSPILEFANSLNLCVHTYGMFAFGMWDIWYYVWLKVLVDWPKTLLDWDTLFLIPLPWRGPVLSPVLIAGLISVVSVLTVVRVSRQRTLKITFLQAGVTSFGALLALYIFMAAPINIWIRGGRNWGSAQPEIFSWQVFLIALLLMAVPSLMAAWPAKKKEEKRPSQEKTY